MFRAQLRNVAARNGGGMQPKETRLADEASHPAPPDAGGGADPSLKK